MGKTSDILEAMRRNPSGNWMIDDIRKVCEQRGCQCLAPTRGSHWKVAAPGRSEILSVPAKRPIKPVYVRKLVAMLEGIEGDGKGD